MIKKLPPLLFVLFLASINCTGENAGSRPPKIRYGEDMCDECKMIINEERFAASVVAEDKTYRFDDIGCMFIFISKHSEIKPIEFWVHDYESLDWIDAKEAKFVSLNDVKTPMGYGIVAFESQGNAQKYAEGKEILSFMDLKGNPPKEMLMQGGIK